LTILDCGYLGLDMIRRVGTRTPKVRVERKNASSKSATIIEKSREDEESFSYKIMEEFIIDWLEAYKSSVGLKILL